MSYCRTCDSWTGGDEEDAAEIRRLQQRNDLLEKLERVVRAQVLVYGATDEVTLVLQALSTERDDAAKETK
jgi:hypothetical protein